MIPCFSCVISTVSRVVAAIGIGIVPQDTLTGGENDIGGDEAAGGGVVIMLHNRSLDRRYGAVKVQSMETSFLISYTVSLGIMSMRITVNIYFLCPDTFICSFPASFRCTDCSPLIDFYLIFR